MRESDIVICGHGSNTPSLKNMEAYLTNRQNTKANNGKSKGLVEAVRFLETDEQRKMFHDLYRGILGRNDYNQDLRAFCYKTYKDGRYYSDCSSSGCLTYVKCGISGVGSYNTAKMHENGKKVDVTIENGHIKESDLGKLQVGDALLFRGNDPSRPLQIGHVEYIYSLPEENEEESKTDNAKEETKTENAKEETYPRWIESGDDWYYRVAKGKNAHGWMDINHHRYYFDEKGKALTGKQTIDGKEYYFATKDLSEKLECALVTFVDV